MQIVQYGVSTSIPTLSCPVHWFDHHLTLSNHKCSCKFHNPDNLFHTTFTPPTMIRNLATATLRPHCLHPYLAHCSRTHCTWTGLAVSTILSCYHGPKLTMIISTLPLVTEFFFFLIKKWLCGLLLFCMILFLSFLHIFWIWNLWCHLSMLLLSIN